MNIKISKEEYKKYHFPICLLLCYIFVSLGVVIALEIVATDIIKHGLSGFLDKLAGIVVVLIVGGILWLVAFFILSYTVKRKMIYRGIGMLYFFTVCIIVLPIAFIVFIIFLKIIGIKYMFFNIVTIFLEFAIPFVLAIQKKNDMKDSLHICPNCGLINSYVLKDSKVLDLGTKHKFHNEGGYTHTWKTSAGVIVQDVPQTTVYDGEFKKTLTTSGYRCSVCGHTRMDQKTTEYRV